jgi:nucleoside-diphosphate-sugar epimerase
MANLYQPIVLVTGATGFLGSSLVELLVRRGQFRVRAFVRQPSKMAAIASTWGCDTSALEVIEGDLLSREDCSASTNDVSIIYHLAAGTGTKSYPEAFRNSVVTTRNLLDAAVKHGFLKRFVNTSSFAVYTNERRRNDGILDESCPVEEKPELRGEAYTYAKVKQDELVANYGKRFQLPFVGIRPGIVYGPGKPGLTSGRIGIRAFGFFAQLGGSNTLPLTYRDNCAEAILTAGTTPGIDGEIFNIVDDDLPSSRKFLRLYKRHVEPIRSIYIPRMALYLGCLAWEKYCRWSDDQLPPVFNRRTYCAYWKRAAYSNAKLKRLTGWKPNVSTDEGLRRFFDSCRRNINHA